MKKIKKGDIVSRNSYQNDILFYVEKIVKTENRGKVAILKGVTIRIEADAPIDDLELPNESRIKENLKIIDKQIEFTNDYIDNRNVIRYGKILHLDGDAHLSNKKKYSNTNTSEQVIFNHNKNNVSKIKIHYFFITKREEFCEREHI